VGAHEFGFVAISWNSKGTYALRNPSPGARFRENLLAQADKRITKWTAPRGQGEISGGIRQPFVDDSPFGLASIGSYSGVG